MLTPSNSMATSFFEALELSSPIQWRRCYFRGELDMGVAAVLFSGSMLDEAEMSISHVRPAACQPRVPDPADEGRIWPIQPSLEDAMTSLLASQYGDHPAIHPAIPLP